MEGGQSSGAVWELRWPSWVSVLSNELYGFRGRKAILNHAHALSQLVPKMSAWHPRTLSSTSSSWKVVYWNQSDIHCNWSDKRPVQLCTITARALLADTLLSPFSVWNTHTDSHTTRYTLSVSVCLSVSLSLSLSLSLSVSVIFFFSFIFFHWESIKQNNSWYVWPIANLFSGVHYLNRWDTQNYWLMWTL